MGNMGETIIAFHVIKSIPLSYIKVTKPLEKRGGRIN